MGRPRKYPRKDDIKNSSTIQNTSNSNTQISSKEELDAIMLLAYIVQNLVKKTT